MPSQMIDNTPMQYRFKDGNPLSDGMASFAASVINAGPAAAQIRQQREKDAVAQAFQAADDTRANRALDLQDLWHSQARDMDMAKAGAYQGDDMALQDIARRVKQAGAQRDMQTQAENDRANRSLDRQDQLTQAQIDNLKADNARASVGQFGEGLNEAAKRGIDVMKLIFTGGRRIGMGSGTFEPVKIRGEDGTERLVVFDKASGRIQEVAPPMPAGQPATTPAAPAAAPSADPAGATATPSLDRVQMQRVPIAIDRATMAMQRIAEAMRSTPDPVARGELQRKAKILADTVNRAKSGDGQAMYHLWEWDNAQPDTQEQAAEDKRMADEMEAGLGAMR